MCLKHKTANAVHGKIDTDVLRWGGYTRSSTKWPTAGAWEIKGANNKGPPSPFAGFYLARQKFFRANMLIFELFLTSQ